MERRFQFFTLAKLLNETYYDLLVQFPARFRGSLHSISLISLHRDQPQLGFTCNYTKLENHSPELIERLLERLRIEKEGGPKRLTPEKKVQSCLIYKSMLLKWRLPFDPDLCFFTDEFAKNADLPTHIDIDDLLNKKKSVADVFAFNTATNALVLIELKAERVKSELESQLCDAATTVRADIPFYADLLAAHGFSWEEPYRIEKVGIWPFVESTRKQYLGKGIKEVGYVEDGCGCITLIPVYSFAEVPLYSFAENAPSILPV